MPRERVCESAQDRASCPPFTTGIAVEMSGTATYTVGRCDTLTSTCVVPCTVEDLPTQFVSLATTIKQRCLSSTHPIQPTQIVKITPFSSFFIMYPYSYPHWHHRPSRFIWFAIGATAAAFWMNRDHVRSGYCHRQPNRPSSVCSGPAAPSSDPRGVPGDIPQWNERERMFREAEDKVSRTVSFSAQLSTNGWTYFSTGD
jgi:hypothetical protein